MRDISIGDALPSSSVERAKENEDNVKKKETKKLRYHDQSLIYHQINTHPPQGIHSPIRILRLLDIHFAEELPHERREPVLDDRLPGGSHQGQHIMDIVDGKPVMLCQLGPGMCEGKGKSYR